MSKLIRVSEEFYDFINSLAKELKTTVVDASKILAESIKLYDSNAVIDLLKEKNKIIIFYVLNSKKKIYVDFEEKEFNKLLSLE